MSYQIKAFDKILEDMTAWVVSHSPNITDFTPGSIIRSYCESVAMGIEEFYVSVYLGFTRTLNDIPSIVFDFQRKAGTHAAVNVVFSRLVAGGSVATIPAGTVITTLSGLRFTTDAVVTIAIGNTSSASVGATAEEVGSDYNVGSASITVLTGSISGVDSVTNALAATGGVNSESDMAYKNRFQAYIEGLGRSNVSGLRVGALSVEGITSVSVVELFPPVAGVNVDLYIDDGTSTGVSTAQIADVQDVIDGDGTSENPGYRAAGINVVVKKPTVVSQNVTATVYVLTGADTAQIRVDIINSLTNYMNTLGVGATIIYNELIAAFLGVYGVTDVALSAPSANVSVTPTQVGRIGSITLSGI